MESDAAQRRIHAVHSHLLPPTADDPQPLLQNNLAAGEFAHGITPLHLFILSK